MDTVEDFPAKTKFMIRIYLPPAIVASEEAKKIVPAIHNHFQYRMLVTERKYRAKLRFGRVSLLIGLSFLAIALIASQTGRGPEQSSSCPAPLLLAPDPRVGGDVAADYGVSLRAVPIIRLKKIYEKISRMEIEILPLPQPG